MISKGYISIFPIKYPQVWDAYKKHLGNFWTAEEISFKDDLNNLSKYSKDELHFLEHVLAFFANSEGLINENLCTRFYPEIIMPEARCFFTVQMLNESIHAETYALQIDTYIKDKNHREKLLNAVENFDCIRTKAEWMNQWLKSEGNLLKRLLAFGLIEGLFFASSFCAVHYFRSNNIEKNLPSLSLSNDWISRDETLHFSFSSLMFRTLSELKKENKLDDKIIKNEACIPDLVSQKEAEEIVRDAVNCEEHFIKSALPVDLIGMDAKKMCVYSHVVADRIMDLFGFERIYNEENPFDFMRALDVLNVTNFFERRVTDYQRPTDREILFDADF